VCGVDEVVDGRANVEIVLLNNIQIILSFPFHL